MRIRAVAIALVLSLMLVLLAACGSSDSDTSTGGEVAGATSGGLTKAAYIKKADAICREAQASQLKAIEAAVAERASTHTTKAEEKAFIREVGLPPIRTELRRLAALEAPKGDEDQIKEWLKEARIALAKVEKEPLAINVNATNPFNAADAKAHKFGFKTCGILL
jgi:hypothetical protein